MKKILFFLIAILITLNISVNAQEISFYEGNYIGGIYMNKVKNGYILYQQARFFKNKENNEAVYCIEPFKTFNENATYKEGNHNLTLEQKEKIKLEIKSHQQKARRILTFAHKNNLEEPLRKIGDYADYIDFANRIFLLSSVGRARGC